MLYWAAVFFIIALIAGALGFGGIAAAALVFDSLMVVLHRVGIRSAEGCGALRGWR